MTATRRRIAPIPVNRTAHISVALRKLIKEQENLLRQAKRRKMNKNRMTGIVKNMIVAAYANSLARQRPNATAYEIRSAVPRGRNLRGPNLRKRLFDSPKNK